VLVVGLSLWVKELAQELASWWPLAQALASWWQLDPWWPLVLVWVQQLWVLVWVQQLWVLV
jgi:hypothetical protein